MIQTVEDYTGLAVVGPGDEPIGTIERTYVDDRGKAKLAEVKIGTLFAKHRLVPVRDGQRVDAGLRVPYSKHIVLHSPEISPGDMLDGEPLNEVEDYYAGDAFISAPTETADRDADNQEPAAVPVSRANDSGNQDLDDVPVATADESTGIPARVDDDEARPRAVDRGDVVDVPIVEEALVKQPVVKEVLRIRKQQVPEGHTVETDLRKEDVEVIREGETGADDGEE